MSTALELISDKLKKDIRNRGFDLLRKGVDATNHSFKLWAERSVL